MDFLTFLTSIVNYIALALTVWLAWYILTRGINQPISWLASLTLWSICGIFINTLLAINPPPIPENVPRWVIILFPFWDSDVLTHGASGWISGWMVIPAIGFWHHLTMLIRTNRWKFWNTLQVIIVYLTIFTAILAIIKTPYMYSEISGNPLLINSLKPGIFYSAFLVQLTIIMLLSFINLRDGYHNTKSHLAKNQLRILAWATLTAGLTAPLSFVAVSIDFNLPRVLISVLLASSVLMIGISVGRFSALIEGRIVRRDFIYSATAMSIVALLYSLVIWISVLLFDVPTAAYIFILVFAFATHSIVDIARHYLDMLFYQKEDRQLRRKIREIATQAGSQGLHETLELELDLACTSIRATSGAIIIFEGKKNEVLAKYNFNKKISKIPQDTFYAKEFQHLSNKSLHPLLENVALLCPIYASEEQTGVILLGPPVNSTQYQDFEIDRFQDVCEEIAVTIEQHQLGNQLLEQAANTIQATRNDKNNIGIFTSKNIESALRNLHDYAFLGDCNLVDTKLVQSRLCDNHKTHLDRGKIVYQIIDEAVLKLQPDKNLTEAIPSREWYPYLILHQAYFEDKLNRDIISYLYISEGTFNRTRRSAIRAVARTLAELENNLP